MAIKFAAEEPKPERLAKARAALAEVEGRREVAPVDLGNGRSALGYLLPPDAERLTPDRTATKVRRGRGASSAGDATPVVAKGKGGFDRVGYQREYMRGWRARRKAKSA